MGPHDRGPDGYTPYEKALMPTEALVDPEGPRHWFATAAKRAEAVEADVKTLQAQLDERPSDRRAAGPGRSAQAVHRRRARVASGVVDR
jgi:hypothetical protein